MRTATFVAAAAALAGSAAAVDCVKGLHMIVGRGTGEPKGLGETGALAKNISEKIPNSDYVAVDYPASLDNPGYEKSEMMGAKDVYNQVTEYHKACPGGKMAYLGWSQGAQIAVNAFCGGQGGIFGNDSAIPADAVKDVVAIAIFGDPSFNKSEPFAKGTSTTDGLFTRNGIGACANFTEKIVSYCNTGDIYCSSGTNTSVHGLYLVKDGAEMQKFVVDNYNKATSGSGSGSGSNSSSTTTSGSSSTTASPTGSKTSGAGASSTSKPKDNAAAGVASGLAFAIPAALVAAAQLLL